MNSEIDTPATSDERDRSDQAEELMIELCYLEAEIKSVDPLAAYLVRLCKPSLAECAIGATTVDRIMQTTPDTSAIANRLDRLIRTALSQ